jgi:hypothetical protein
MGAEVSDEASLMHIRHQPGLMLGRQLLSRRRRRIGEETTGSEAAADIQTGHPAAVETTTKARGNDRIYYQDHAKRPVPAVGRFT